MGPKVPFSADSIRPSVRSSSPRLRWRLPEVLESGVREEVFPATREQRCWFHKQTNVLAALPKSALAAIKEIYNARTLTTLISRSRHSKSTSRLRSEAGYELARDALRGGLRRGAIRLS